MEKLGVIPAGKLNDLGFRDRPAPAFDHHAGLNLFETHQCLFFDGLGTVAFAGFRWARDSAGRRRLKRTYTFDYTSDGFERAQGFIVLSGARLEAVGLAGSPS